MMRPLVKLNVGGRPFQVMSKTLTRYPHTPLAAAVQTHFANMEQLPTMAAGQVPDAATAPVPFAAGLEDLCATTPEGELFVDADPAAFEAVLQFLRTGKVTLPTDSEPDRASVVWLLEKLQLTEHAFPPVLTDAAREAAAEGEEGSDEAVSLPDVVVVQLNDSMTHEQGVKRHAVNVTYGSDGFQVKRLCKAVRKDLKTQLSSTFWQMYQTNERAAFFISTKVNNGTADLMTTSLSQRVIEHTETMGYSLVSSYVTLSPDVVHTSVRMFIHYLIFRRTRQPSLQASDEDQLVAVAEGAAPRDAVDAGGFTADEDMGGPEFRNFEPPRVGPMMRPPQPETVPAGQRVGKIWE